jgi:Clr5 domain
MAGVAANAPSPEGWQLAKSLIEQLYVQQDKPLKEVRSYLAEHRNFLATERMYKQRLKEWGFDRKKVKAAEWRYMLRVTRRRRIEGKESAFRVNGKVIIWSNIRKHLKRKKKTEEEFLLTGSDAEVVDDVVCYTPPGSPTLCMAQAPPSQRSFSSQSSNYLPHSTAANAGRQWRGGVSDYPFSPEPEQNGPEHPRLSVQERANNFGLSIAPPPPPIALTPESYNCFSPSLSSEGSSISDTELHSIVLRPISIKTWPPLDEAAALRISRMMSGAHDRLNFASQSERQPPSVSMNSNEDPVDSHASIRSSSLPDINMAEPLRGVGQHLSEEDMASRWVVYYFQACICESQRNFKRMDENVRQASRVFRSMLRSLNPFLLTGLTLMTSILYFHDHAQLLEQFLEDSCHVIEKVFSKTHPIVVPYRYMLLSVRGEPKEQSAMSSELRQAYEAFQLTWGKVHSNTLTALYYYGCSLLDGQKFDEAELQLQLCFQLSEENLGPSHFVTVWTLATLSRTLSSSNTGRETEAVRYLQAAIDRCRRMMHEEHPYCLELNRILATIHEKLGNTEDVESLLRFVLSGRIKILGLKKEITRASVNDLYEFLIAKNKLREAAQLQVEISAMEKKNEGYPTHGISY